MPEEIITCWNCERTYDFLNDSVCPNCGAHHSDVQPHGVLILDLNDDEPEWRCPTIEELRERAKLWSSEDYD